MAILSSLPGTIRRLRYPGGLNLIRRESGGKSSLGESLPPIESMVLLDPVVVQPTEGRDRLQLPEGDRDSESILLHTCQMVRVSKGGSTKLADVVLYDSAMTGELSRYVLRLATAWRVQAGMWRAIAVREETDG